MIRVYLPGYNTMERLYETVKAAGFHIYWKENTLLGAGGAATAIASQAALDGVSEINIFSRKTKFWDRAGRLADTLNSRTDCKVSLYELADTTSLKASLKDSAILTNGTSVGMAPDMEHSLITEPEFFHEGLIVSDVIYNPRETMLMKLARENGCHTFNGLYMLYYQGSEAFRLWTGIGDAGERNQRKVFSAITQKDPQVRVFPIFYGMLHLSGPQFLFSVPDVSLIQWKAVPAAYRRCILKGMYF